MSFVDPWWLAAAVPACAAMLCVWRIHDRRQRAALARFVAAHLQGELTRSISLPRRHVQRGLFLLAVLLLLAALARPQWGYRWEEISQRGNEIVFAIDTSRSMSTPDVKPDRLTRAKLAIDDFTKQLDGDAVGIVAFAGTAFLACPITLDYGAFHEALNAIDTNTVPHGGTNISSAIREAQAALRRRSGGDRILILVTDGEDLEGGALAAARAAKRDDGLRIFTVGVGTANGDLIPIPLEQGGGFVKDENGEFVKSRLDEAALTAIAAATGGIHVPLGTQGEGLQYLYTTAIGPLAKHDLASRRQRIYLERFQWPLAASLGLLLASLTVGTRRRGARLVEASAPRTAMRALAGGSSTATGTSSAAAGAPSTAAAIVFALIALSVREARADTLDAARAYQKGDFAAAEQAYADAARRDPAKPALHYDLGAAQYREGKFPQAVEAFQQAIAQSPSSDPKRLADQEDAYYDLGNALYRAGEKTQQSNPQLTLQQWNDAIKAYDTALKLRADDADAKYNRDLVRRKIDDLKQRSQQNQGQSANSNHDSRQNQGKGQQQPSHGEAQGQQPDDASQGAPQPQGANQSQPQSANQSQPQSGSEPQPQSANQPPPQDGGQQPRDARQQPAPDADQPSPPRKGQARGNPEDQIDEAGGESDDRPQPGQMTRQEARDLLDSVKGEERLMLMAPLNRRDSRDDSQPLRNW